MISVRQTEMDYGRTGGGLPVDFLKRHPSKGNTQRGRSRAQHVRDRDADIENAKNWHLVHLQRLKREARMAEPTFGMCFRARAAKEANGEARRAKPMLWLF